MSTEISARYVCAARSLQTFDNGGGEVGGGGRSSHVGSLDLTSVDHVERRSGNLVGDRVKSSQSKSMQNRRDRKHPPQVPEQHGSAEDHGRRVGTVGTHDVAGDMAASRLEQGVFLRQLRPE